MPSRELLQAVTADRDRWRELAGRLAKAGVEVMDLLESYGGSIVPHLLDTDENAGEQLRRLIADYERAANDTVSTERG